MYCINCGEEVQSSIYPETGEESYCKCQCTLDAEFKSEYWKE